MTLHSDLDSALTTARNLNAAARRHLAIDAVAAKMPAFGFSSRLVVITSNRAIYVCDKYLRADRLAARILIRNAADSFHYRIGGLLCLISLFCITKYLGFGSAIGAALSNNFSPKIMALLKYYACVDCIRNCDDLPSLLLWLWRRETLLFARLYAKNIHCYSKEVSP